jgi:hypothetical protein
MTVTVGGGVGVVRTATALASPMRTVRRSQTPMATVSPTSTNGTTSALAFLTAQSLLSGLDHL